MNVITRTQRIHAEAGRAWSVLADVERWPEWTPTVTSLTPLGGGGLGVGAGVRITQPGLAPATWTVTRWEPGRGFAWNSGGPGFHTRAEHDVTPREDRCEVTLRVEFSGLLGGLFFRLMGPLTARYVAIEAAGLAARCEGRPGPASLAG